ncbi:hypothetical protein [Deinococcus petrolearius]|uniref:IrrE N-terminal-like domain-containing protein n=1 Tax=Deinococcus petrolearius TaxID=1751295 RepID=A0ABW1DM21_9DEIO
MATPTLYVHLIDDPTQPPVLDGDRGIVVSEVCRKARQAVPIESRHREAFMAAAADLRERLPITSALFSKESLHEIWDALDILMFQSTPSNTDAQRCRGVSGWYNNGIDQPMKLAPFVELYILPGHEARTPAAATHELGHFIRARAVWKEGTKPFIYKAYEEGLCENLVEREIGKGHVLHDVPLSYQDLIKLQTQLLRSVKDIEGSQAHEDFTLEGYRLGYYVVNDLIKNGHTLEDLFVLPLLNTQEIMLEGCRLLIDRSAST